MSPKNLWVILKLVGKAILSKACLYFTNPTYLSFLLYSNRKNTRNNPILQEYVLPDFSRNKKGYIRVFFLILWPFSTFKIFTSRDIPEIKGECSRRLRNELS